MAHPWKIALAVAASIALAGGAASAQEHGGGHEGGGGHAGGGDGGGHAGGGGEGSHAGGGAPRGEPHAGPRGYARPSEPAGWNARPKAADPGAYHHNFQAPRTYRIGAYHAPRGWTYRRWGYGQILPRAYWASQYILGDYWLFGLEVPPVGFEWVRSGPDALLMEYGAFV
jgi:Ni/Co efflux regulator RcnB